MMPQSSPHQPEAYQPEDSPSRDSAKPARYDAEIAELERKRIGREFHDGLGQKLTSVSIATSILVEKLEEKGAPEAADARRLLHMIRGTVRDARNLARGLNPASLLNKGLENALDELLTEIHDTTDMSTSLQVDDWRPGDAQRELHVFRIIQEAVHNAVKHSEGSHITVVLLTRDGAAQAEVLDDGRGLPSDLEGSEGMGIVLMNQRAKALGGTIAVEERGGGGTALRLSFDADS